MTLTLPVATCRQRRPVRVVGADEQEGRIETVAAKDGDVGGCGRAGGRVVGELRREGVVSRVGDGGGAGVGSGWQGESEDEGDGQ